MRYPIFYMRKNNLLDNALEAVSDIPEDKRYIKLSGNLKDNFFLIKIYLVNLITSRAITNSSLVGIT